MPESLREVAFRVCFVVCPCRRRDDGDAQAASRCACSASCVCARSCSTIPRRAALQLSAGFVARRALPSQRQVLCVVALPLSRLRCCFCLSRGHEGGMVSHRLHTLRAPRCHAVVRHALCVRATPRVVRFKVAQLCVCVHVAAEGVRCVVFVPLCVSVQCSGSRVAQTPAWRLGSPRCQCAGRCAPSAPSVVRARFLAPAHHTSCSSCQGVAQLLCAGCLLACTQSLPRAHQQRRRHQHYSWSPLRCTSAACPEPRLADVIGVEHPPSRRVACRLRCCRAAPYWCRATRQGRSAAALLTRCTHPAAWLAWRAAVALSSSTACSGRVPPPPPQFCPATACGAA